jgi:hypothetical protein
LLRYAKHLYFWGSLITPSENSVTRYAKHFHGNPQDPENTNREKRNEKFQKVKKEPKD